MSFINQKNQQIIQNLSENDITKVIGLTVDIKMIGSDEIITGFVYTFLKSNNMLILLRKEINDQITSFIINLNYLSEIKISNTTIEVNFDELITPNVEKIFENERKNSEKDSLLKKSERNNIESQVYQTGFAIYEKLSKL